MPEFIVSDKICLILFHKIGRFDLLYKTYQTLWIPPVVKEEFGELLPDWIRVQDIQNKERQQLLEKKVDKGEAGAIELALELRNTLLIIDDKKGRQLAKASQIEITGALGVLLLAKRKGIVVTIKPILSELIAAGYRISPEIAKGVLKRAGE